MKATVTSGLILTTCLSLVAGAAPFTSGNLVIYRVGTGTGSLLSSATPVFLDEYSPAGVLVQSIPLPTAVSGIQRRLTASGTANSEGALQRSADRRWLTATGYDADVGTASVAVSSSATVARTVAFLDVSGTVDSSTGVTAFNANNIRSAVSGDGTGAWLCGGTSGIIYAARGSSGSGTVVSAASSNNRSIDIAGGQLFFSSGSGSYRFAQVGSGLPVAAGTSISQIAGGPAAAGSPYQFSLFDLDAGTAGVDTLYVADDSAAGGIQKFCLNAVGTWEAKGSVTGTGEVTGLRGLTGALTGGTVTLYATTSIRLVGLTDATGFNGTLAGTLSVLASAPTGTGFRGVDFAPVAAAPPAPPLGIAAAGNTVTVSWPSSSPGGWFLQENSQPGAPGWLPSSGVVDDGTVKRLSLPNAAGRKFFRLALP